MALNSPSLGPCVDCPVAALGYTCLNQSALANNGDPMAPTSPYTDEQMRDFNCDARRAGNESQLARIMNVLAYQTHTSGSPQATDYYVEGDVEAQDSGIGPGLGDPSFTGPYE